MKKIIVFFSLCALINTQIYPGLGKNLPEEITFIATTPSRTSIKLKRPALEHSNFLKTLVENEPTKKEIVLGETINSTHLEPLKAILNSIETTKKANNDADRRKSIKVAIKDFINPLLLDKKTNKETEELRNDLISFYKFLFMLNIPLAEEAVAEYIAQAIIDKKINPKTFVETYNISNDLLSPIAFAALILGTDISKDFNIDFDISIQHLLDYGYKPNIEKKNGVNVLNLNDMHLDSIEGLENIKNIETVSMLNLSNNRLTTWDSTAKLPKLTVLLLHNNNMKKISNELLAVIKEGVEAKGFGISIYDNPVENTELKKIKKATIIDKAQLDQLKK